ncbi:MAG: hypothetical protein KGQ40_00085 [Rhodospirillales bacterium]|nr:hypothetical protein [Rhodospirillales bacterium]
MKTGSLCAAPLSHCDGVSEVVAAVGEMVRADHPVHDARELLAKGYFAEARDVLREQLAAGTTTRETMVNLAIAEDRLGNLSASRALLTQLSDNEPDWDEPFLRLAESWRGAGEPAEAEAYFEAALQRNPAREEAMVALGALLVQRGAFARAQMLMLRCCCWAPHNAEAWDLLGITLQASRDDMSAAAAFAEAVRLAPERIAIVLRLGDAAMAAGKGLEELARLEQRGLEDPLDVIALTARGHLLGRLGRYHEAADILEAATCLAPKLPEAAAGLAHAMVKGTRTRETLLALDRAIALAPDDLTLRNNKAAFLVRVHRHRQAREELEALIDQHGEQSGFLCNLTNALVSLGLQEKGVATARRATELWPTESLSWRTLSNAMPYSDEVSAAELLRVNMMAGAALPRDAAPAFSNARNAERRLRIGLLSNNLRTHPVGWLTIAGFEALDPAHHDIVCISRNVADDAIQRRFRAVASDWVCLGGGEGAPGPVDDIRRRQLDIVIDLGGFGDQGLMTLCASRLAPVQIKWVGSQSHSTGLAEMDWFITDRWETPPSLARRYSERLLVMPDGYVCYSPPAYAPEVAALPALSRGHVTFGCFNNLAKITTTVIATWATILRRVEGARLVLKCHQLADAQTCERLIREFARHGVSADRIEMRGASPHRELLAQFGDIDIVLDPFPYGGGLTTCEALWMGVPTVTFPGETFASRHSFSHLSNVGLADWIARDRESYCELACHHAADVRKLAELRAVMRARVEASPLCDAPRFGRNLGAALRHAWSDWCARGAA